jgi:hypothetical protein
VCPTLADAFCPIILRVEMPITANARSPADGNILSVKKNGLTNRFQSRKTAEAHTFSTLKIYA